MQLAGRYSYAGREWVTERVCKIIGGNVTDRVHNHRNYAWREHHDGRDLWFATARRLHSRAARLPWGTTR
jgi:tRNA-splicing ligase RtcB